MEIFNTDAEGRVILSDGLSYASKHYDPEYILDFATLTGAVVVALGHIATGVMGTDDELMIKVKNASKSSGEKVWEFPLWPEFCKQIKNFGNDFLVLYKCVNDCTILAMYPR